MFSISTPFPMALSQESSQAGLKYNRISPEEELQGWVYGADADRKTLPLSRGCEGSYGGRSSMLTSTSVSPLPSARRQKGSAESRDGNATSAGRVLPCAQSESNMLLWSHF